MELSVSCGNQCFMPVRIRNYTHTLTYHFIIAISYLNILLHESPELVLLQVGVCEIR